MTLPKTLAIVGCVALGAALVSVDAKATPPPGSTSVFVTNLIDDPVPIDGVVDIATMPAIELAATRTHVAASGLDHVTLRKDHGQTQFYRVHVGGFVEPGMYVVPLGKALIVTDVSYDGLPWPGSRFTFQLLSRDPDPAAVPAVLAMIVSATSFAHQEFPGGVIVGPGRKLITEFSNDNGIAQGRGVIHGYLVAFNHQPR